MCCDIIGKCIAPLGFTNKPGGNYVFTILFMLSYHPAHAELYDATAVENMCDSHRKYVRRLSKICATAVARNGKG
jgi:hypothetical protein